MKLFVAAKHFHKCTDLVALEFVHVRVAMRNAQAELLRELLEIEEAADDLVCRQRDAPPDSIVPVAAHTHVVFFDVQLTARQDPASKVWSAESHSKQVGTIVVEHSCGVLHPTPPVHVAVTDAFVPGQLALTFPKNPAGQVRFTYVSLPPCE